VLPAPRLQIPACDVAATLRLQRELGISAVLAQVLVRRGFDDPGTARAWLAADDRHGLESFGGLAEAAGVVRRHVQAGSRIFVHGDYDVDGMASTAILVRALRELGADAGWFLPSRTEDGYGLSAATVARLAERGTGLLITVDCAITAVEEVAAARAAGMDVVVTDHHSPLADGELPAAPIVHPRVGAYPCPDLCGAGVAHALARALREDGAERGEDLELVALATVADCVPLRGENRRLVRDGLRAMGATRSAGLRALMQVAKADPARIDARAIGFRLAPRLNAAGRLYRADAGVELLLTRDEDRARAIAEELDRANAERRHVEQRILFEAEGMAAEAGECSAYVLAGEGWHPGVIGIVASRIAERHHRPCVLVALDGEQGTGSGRSIPAFDLLGGLDACAQHLQRHGGHRAAAGCQVRREDVDAFRAAFQAHAEQMLRPEDLVPVQHVDAVVAGDELGMSLAEELEQLAPFGTANPDVALLVPAARLCDPRPMGEGRHVRFTVVSGGRRAQAVAFGVDRVDCDGPVDAVFAQEVNEGGGAVSPRLVLRHALRRDAGAIEVVGEPADYVGAVLAMLDAGEGLAFPRDGSRGDGSRPPWPAGPMGPLPAGVARRVRDRRGGGIAGIVAALVHTGEPVLVVVADAAIRARQLAGIAGGIRVCAHAALQADPSLADGAHVVVVDPPRTAAAAADLAATAPGRTVHLAWGEPEVEFTRQLHEREHGLRDVLSEIYRDLRDANPPNPVVGEALEAALRGQPPRPRTAALAGRALRVLAELRLVHLDREARRITVPVAERTSLDESAWYRAEQVILDEGRRWLTRSTAQAQAA
jgi:single-stranded-DNA-specific exonuclease